MYNILEHYLFDGWGQDFDAICIHGFIEIMKGGGAFDMGRGCLFPV